MKAKLIKESLNEMDFGKTNKLKKYLSKRMNELERKLEKDETNVLADARLEELVFIMDMMNWDLIPE